MDFLLGNLLIIIIFIIEISEKTILKPIEKKTFFNQIHNILNNPKILEFNLNGSQINPKLIKNFYEIALHNEIKNNANTLLSKEIIKRDEIELNEKINSLNKKSKRKILNFENNFINSENFKIEKPKLLRRFSTNPIKNNYLKKENDYN